MRFKEILFEDYVQDMEGHVQDMLVTLKAHGVKEVNLEQISQELGDIGFDIDETLLTDLLSNSDIISKIERGVAYLDTEQGTEGWMSPEEEEKEEDKLSDKAISAIRSKMKTGAEREKKAASQVGKEE
jgi:hypothetical protein